MSRPNTSSQKGNSSRRGEVALDAEQLREELVKTKELLTAQTTLAEARLVAKEGTVIEKDARVRDLQAQLQEQDHVLQQDSRLVNYTEKRNSALEKSVKVLEEQLHNARKEIESLKVLPNQLAKDLELAKKTASERANLRHQVSEQEKQIQRQQTELARRTEEQSTSDSLVASLNMQMHDLSLKASGTAELRVFHNELWLTKVSTRRIAGDQLRLLPNNAIACLGGEVIVHMGACSSKGQKDSALQILDIGTMSWRQGVGRPPFLLPPSRPVSTASISTRSVLAFSEDSLKTALTNAAICALNENQSKMVLFGGEVDGEVQNHLRVLHTEVMKWGTPQLQSLAAPSPRHSSSITCHASLIFTFGGEAKEGEMLSDLWQFDMQTMTWSQLWPPPSLSLALAVQSDMPCPRSAASLTASQDGKTLWLVGGNNGTQSLSDVYNFKVDAATWAKVGGQAEILGARQGHCTFLSGNFLVVAGGLRRLDPNSHPQQLTDILALDTTNSSWEEMDAGAWMERKGHEMHQPDCLTFSSHGTNIYALKGSRTGAIEELVTMSLVTPEAIAKLLEAHKKGATVFHTLDILPNAYRTDRSIDLAWRPPTKNAERIEKYKVTMVNASGLLRGVYEGSSTNCQVSDLMSGVEYVFSVKANYTDGSYARSAPASFTTRIV